MDQRFGPYANKADGFFAWYAISRLLNTTESAFVNQYGYRGVARPIKLISGNPFLRNFFDNVKVLKENLIGNLNEGWSIANNSSPMNAK